MTTDQMLHLINGLEPFLTIIALNILLAIWILVRINRNYRNITAVKNLLTDMRRHEVTILKPFTSSTEQDVQPSPQGPKPEPTEIKATTDNSEIDGFLKALQEGTDIDEAAKLFHLTEDEARVAEISYRTARGLGKRATPYSDPGTSGAPYPASTG
jgi:hypothetical protein